MDFAIRRLLYFARDLTSATFSLSNTPHLRSVVPRSFSYESLRKFIHRLLYMVSRCYDNDKTPFNFSEFLISYAISTSLHHDRTSRVHAIVCRMP